MRNVHLMTDDSATKAFFAQIFQQLNYVNETYTTEIKESALPQN